MVGHGNGKLIGFRFIAPEWSLRIEQLLIAALAILVFPAPLIAGLSSADADHLWDLAASVAGGIIGALAGGVPAYLLATKAARESADKDRRTQVDGELALVHSTFVKLLEIVNGTYTICSQVNDMLYQSHAKGARDKPLWQRVIPLVGFDDSAPIRFDSKEIALFMRGSDAHVEFANELMLLDKRYSTLRASIKDYSVRREALADKLTIIDAVDEFGTTTLEKKEFGKLLPLMMSLDSVADHLVKTMHHDRRTAQRLSARFGGLAKELFPNNRVPGFATARDDRVGI